MTEDLTKSWVRALIAVGALLIAMSVWDGCGPGTVDVSKALPAVGNGVHLVGTEGHRALHVECLRRARKCQGSGVTDRQQCPGWLKCDAVRVALEEVIRATEGNLQATDKVLKMIKRLQEEQL